MDNLTLKLVLTPALIGTATLAGRRWGQSVGGWLVGLPLTTGPVAFFIALDHGAAFGAAAVVGSLRQMQLLNRQHAMLGQFLSPVVLGTLGRAAEGRLTSQLRLTRQTLGSRHTSCSSDRVCTKSGHRASLLPDIPPSGSQRTVPFLS